LEEAEAGSRELDALIARHVLLDTLERQAAEIERLRGALRNIQIEAEREDGRWVHLKRVIAINARAALGAKATDTGREG
jgi:hypothetical protein